MNADHCLELWVTLPKYTLNEGIPLQCVPLLIFLHMRNSLPHSFTVSMFRTSPCTSRTQPKRKNLCAI